MPNDDTRKGLENIVRGVVLEGEGNNCTTARNLLCAGFRTSTTVKKDFENQSRVKKEQTEFLKHHSSLNSWWVNDSPDENIIVNSNTLFFIDTVFYTVSG